MAVVDMTPVDPVLLSACGSVEQSDTSEHTVASVASEQDMKAILAERYKTKLCRNYLETGVCPYSIRCMFAHGEHELRTPQMNINDGLLTEEAIRMFQRQWRSFYLASSSPAPATMFWSHCSGYPTLPPFYETGCVCNCGCNMPMPTPSTGMIMQPRFYAHDTYNSHVLPPESRFYSTPPLFAGEPLSSMMQYNEAEDVPCNGRCACGGMRRDFRPAGVQGRQASPSESCAVYGRRPSSEARRITVEIPMTCLPAEQVRGDEEDAEFSSCSSIGGVSWDQQQFVLDSMRSKPSQAPDSDAVEEAEL